MNEKCNKNAKIEKIDQKGGERCTPYRYRSFVDKGGLNRYHNFTTEYYFSPKQDNSFDFK